MPFLTTLSLSLTPSCLYLTPSQGFMGDRTYSFPDTLASEVLEEGLKQSALRDEIYVQLMKQCAYVLCWAVFGCFRISCTVDFHFFLSLFVLMFPNIF